MNTDRLDPDLLLGLGRLDLVTDLDVVEATQADTALEVRPDLGDVVLEAAQRVDLEVVPHHDAVADDPGTRVARDRAAADDDAGDVADLGRPEDLADLGEARLDLLVLRLEHALEGLLHVLEGRVDDGVEPDVDALTSSPLAGL